MKRIACAVVLGSVIALSAGCVEGPADAPSGSPELALVRDADGVAGTLRLRDGQISISASSAGGRVWIEVSGAGGEAHARIERDLIHNATSGSIGGQPFGRAEDSATDLDPSLWATIARSHTGDVLRAVSAATARLAEQDEHLAARDEVATLARLAPMLASMAFDDGGAADPEVLGVCSNKSMRVSVTGGTAYLATSTCDSTRTGSVVNECTGSTVSWRVRSYSTGATINSGTKGNCVGGGIGTFYQKIWLEVKNAYGYWEGFASY